MGVGVGGLGGGGLGVGRHCESIGVAGGASEMVWREGCGQALGSWIHGRRMAKVVPLIEVSRVLTFWSCGGSKGRRLRGSANETWVAMSGLKSSGRMRERACDHCHRGERGTGDSSRNAIVADEGDLEVDCFRARLETLQSRAN